jgi:hypothetical protein
MIGGSPRARVGPLCLLVLLVAAGCGPAPAPAIPTAPDTDLPSLTASPGSSPVPQSTSTPTGEALASPTAEPTPAFVTEFADVAYQLPVTLQDLAADSAVIFFELERPAAGMVVVRQDGPDGAVASRIAFDAARARHMFRLAPLDPDRAYAVRIGLLQPDGSLAAVPFQDQAWDPLEFRTLPDPPTRLRVAVVGDSGFGQPETAALVEEIAQHNPDFLLHTGDIVYRVHQERSPAAAFARKYYLPFAPVLRTMPVYPVVGNHEWDADTFWQGLPFVYWTFPPLEPLDPGGSPVPSPRDWYALERGPVQFLLLNTQLLLRAGRTPEQTAWLRERLGDARFRFSIPVFHVAPYTSGLHARDGLAIRSDWQPLFESARVPLVLSGHDHNYERLIVGDIQYVVSGGGSATLYSLRARLPQSQVFVARTHFVLLEITPDEIQLTALALGGEVLDRVTIGVP